MQHDIDSATSNLRLWTEPGSFDRVNTCRGFLKDIKFRLLKDYEKVKAKDEIGSIQPFAHYVSALTCGGALEVAMCADE